MNLTLDDVSTAWDLYFSGKPPFRATKNRNDLPDGHIFASALALHSRLKKTIHVVLIDGALKSAFERTPGFIVHPSLGDFLSSKQIRAALLEYERANGIEVEDSSRAQWAEFVDSEIHERSGDINNIIAADIKDYLMSAVIESDQLPSDNHEATVYSIGDIESVDLDTASADYWGRDSALLPATIRVSDCGLDLYIHKSEFNSMDEEELVRFSICDPDWNEHYVQAEARVTLSVSAKVRVELSSEDGILSVEGAVVEDVEKVEVAEWD